MSKAFESKQKHNDDARNGMKRDGYVECESCGYLFAPMHEGEEQEYICENCIQAAIERMD